MEDIRALRAELGVTQIELAEMLGLHQSTISRLESGMIPLDERTRLACEALLARRHNAQLAGPTESPPPFPAPLQGTDLPAHDLVRGPAEKSVGENTRLASESASPGCSMRSSPCSTNSVATTTSEAEAA